MKILLVYPPIYAEVPAKSTLLGLGYLASVLRERGHEVKILDFVKGIKYTAFKPDVICVSAMFTDYKEGIYEVLEWAKGYYTVVGGIHASLFPEEIIKSADAVVVGEGEQIICDIVENKRKGIFRTERIEDLDSLPMPAWDLMMNDIMTINEESRKSPFHMRYPIIHLITSRGCPNECTFCAVKTIWGRQWKTRSPANIIKEILYLYNLGFKEFHIMDDNCSIDKIRMYELCRRIINLDLDIKLATPTGIQIKNLDKDLLRIMKDAGFYRLCFGIETGSQDMQYKIKKNIDLKKAKQTIKDANDLGFWTAATFILGFPEETDMERLDTLDFAKESGLDFPIFYSLNPQPKTEIYEKMTGRTDYNILISEFYKDFIWYKLSHWLTYANMLKKIKNTEDLKYMTGLIKTPLRMLFKKRLHNEGIRGR